MHFAWTTKEVDEHPEEREKNRQNPIILNLSEGQTQESSAQSITELSLQQTKGYCAWQSHTSGSLLVAQSTQNQHRNCPSQPAGIIGQHWEATAAPAGPPQTITGGAQVSPSPAASCKLPWLMFPWGLWVSCLLTLSVRTVWKSPLDRFTFREFSQCTPPLGTNPWWQMENLYSKQV